MELEFFHIIGIIAFFQCLLLALVFFNNKKEQLIANRIFSTLLIVFAFLIGYSLSNCTGIADYFQNYSKTMFILGQIGFLIGPLLYFYFKSILDQKFSFRKRDLVHGIPFMASMLFFSIYIYPVMGFFPWQTSENLIYGIGILTQELVYFILIVSLLKKHNIKMKDFLSRTNDPIKVWLRIFIIGYILIWNTKLQSFVLLDVYNRWGFCPYADSMYFLTMFLLFNAILYVALKRPELLYLKKKYTSSELNEKDIINYRAKLVKLMEKEKPYLEPSLTMPALAKRLSMPTRHLSQVINESCNKNFCDFINEYRIIEIRKVFLDQANGYKSILEIAYDVGFNSKSAFNRAFKKLTGLTPKDFKKNIQREYKLDYSFLE